MKDFKLITKLGDFIKTHTLIISLTIPILTFLFARLPFFIWCPLPFISIDSYEYYYMVEQLKNNQLPILDVLPPFYVFFLYTIDLITDTLFSVLIAQHLIFLSASIFLIYSLYRCLPKATLLVSIFLSAQIMQGGMIMFDSLINPDTLYRSALIFLASTLMFLFKNNTLKNWILLAIILFSIITIRSNGIYILFLIPILFFVHKISENKKKYLLFFITFFLLNLSWAFYNYFADNHFLIGNYSRFKNVYGYVVSEKKETTNKTTDDASLKGKSLVLINMLSNVSAEFNFYTVIPLHCSQIKYFSQQTDTTFDAVEIRFNDQLHKATLKEFYNNNEPCENLKYSFESEVLLQNNRFQKYIDYYHQTNIWITLYQVYISIKKYVFNVIFILAAYFAAIISLLIYVKNKNNRKDANFYLLTIFVLIHLLSILSITAIASTGIIATGSSMRYAASTEFTVYLVIAIVFNYIFSPKQIFTKIKSFFNKKQSIKE